MARKKKKKKGSKKKNSKVKKKPTVAPASAVMTRDGSKFTATWKVPSSATNKKSKSRWQGIAVRWQLYQWDYKKKKWVWVNWGGVIKIGVKNTSHSKSINAASWYPNKSPRLAAVRCMISGRNDKDKNGKKKYATCQFNFANFDKPGDNGTSFDQDTGIWSYRIKNEQGSATNTYYFKDIFSHIIRRDSFNKSFREVVKWGSGGTASTREYDVYDFQALKVGQWIEIQGESKVRSIKGETDLYILNHVFAYPAKASITGAAVATSGNSLEPGGSITIYIKTNAEKYAPVDTVQLQILKNTTISKANEAVMASGWEDVENAKDNGNCTGLADLIPNAWPETRGHHVWYRIKSMHDGLVRYSAAVGDVNNAELKKLYRKPKSAEDDKVSIIYCESADDGSSALVRFGYLAKSDDPDDEDGDDADGTEVYWSTDPNAWQSTQPPESYQINWDDDTPWIDPEPSETTIYYYKQVKSPASNPKAAGYYELNGTMYILTEDTIVKAGKTYYIRNNWPRTSHIYIRGLTENELYYVNARRYMDMEDGGITYGPYSEFRQVVPVSTPTQVELTAPSYIIRGQSIPVSWTYNSSAQQREWALKPSGDAWHRQSDYSYSVISDPQGNPHENSFYELIDGQYILSSDTIVAEGKTYYSRDELQVYEYTPETGYLLDNGEDALGNAVISAERLEGLVDLSFFVTMRTGGAWANSEPITVHIVDAPTFTFTSVDTFTAQPLSFSISTTYGPDLQIVYKLEATQTQSTFKPDGEHIQAIGDSIWSEKLLSPTWIVVEGTPTRYTYDVTLPADLDLMDNGNYTLYVKVVDAEKNLESELLQKDISIKWAHQAEPPEGTLIFGNTGDRTVKIYPQKPANYIETDTVDVYRVTPDGAYLIGTGLPFDKVIVDRYAPFSAIAPLSYRITTKTIDGDIEWTEVPYNVENAYLRLDWGLSSVELPYNVSTTDSFSKHAEIREKLDGSEDGYFNAGYSRTGSLDTEIIKVDYETRALLRDMAQYPGPVFVRTPDGCAYQANVEVTSLPYEYNTLTSSVSLSAREITLTDEFMINPDADVLERN